MAGTITVVGLGPGSPDLRTVGTQRALDEAARIVLRTAIHPGIQDLAEDPRVTTCDDLYQSAESFDGVYTAICDHLLRLAVDQDLVYAVPGHPRFGERSVTLLLSRAAEVGVSIRLLAGVSALDVISTVLGVDLLTAQPQLLDAADLAILVDQIPFSGGLLDVVSSRPCLVSQVYSRAIASAVKLALGRVYPEDHQVEVVTAAGVPGSESVTTIPLYEIDRLPVDHLTSLWVPALPRLEAAQAAPTLHYIAAVLRSPGGCPWDRKQTHASLRDTVIEEAYEVVDAIDDGDADHLAEELGDLLLQVALHAQIAEEAETFTIEDVYDHVNRKLVRRHPHVFADAHATTPAEVVQTWQGVKDAERRHQGAPMPPLNPYDKLPRSMPVLTKVARLIASRERDPLSSNDLSPGQRLLDVVDELIHTGLDPEMELAEAARRRYGAPHSPIPAVKESSRA